MNIDKGRFFLDKICGSDTFKNAPTSQALLQFLFNSLCDKTELKESIIDIDFFGSKGISDKANPRVRVNVYNLRKKLDAYYEDDGKDDEFQLVLDKGQYNLSIVKRIGTVDKIKKLNPLIIIPYILIVILAIAIVIISLPPLKPKVWKEFLDDKISCTLFIGDAFGMIGTTVTGNHGWTRDYSINNISEFYKFCESSPELKDKLLPPPYSYSTQMGVLSTKYLQHLFFDYNKDFDIRFLTKSSIDDVKRGNSIYIGPIKNDNMFIDFFNEENKNLKIKDSLLYIKNHPSIADTVFVFPYRVRNEEYAIVSKIPGPNGTEQLLFFSNHDIGVSSTFQYFTVKDSLDSFTNMYLDDNKYFTAIFRAKGQDRTDTDLELIMVVTE